MSRDFPRPALRRLIAACLLPVACASPPMDTPGFSPAAWPETNLPADIILGPGDTVELVFHSAPELNRTAQVAADGTLRLPFIAPVQVAATTPATARLRLEAAYRGQLVDPALDLLPVAQAPPRVFVGGAVGTPGPVTLDGPTDPLQALILAGGPTREAWLGEVVLMRRNPAGEVETRTIDLASALRNPGAADWFALQRYDVVYVPRSKIADQNRFVAQYIRKALPLDFFLVYGLGNAQD